MSKKDGRKFQEDELKDPSFKEWLKKVSDPRQYRCTVCHKTLSLSTTGRASLTEHANGGKHKEAGLFLTHSKNVSLHVSSNIDSESSSALPPKSNLDFR